MTWLQGTRMFRADLMCREMLVRDILSLREWRESVVEDSPLS